MRTSVLVITIALAAALPAQTWQARYNGLGNDDDAGRAIAVDGSGNTYVAGASWGTGTSYDAALIKYGPAGESLWARRYDGAAHGPDEARALALGDGFVVVTGGTSDANLFTDIVTIAYDAGGDPIWTATYDGPSGGNDMGYAVAVDAAGNAYVTGYAHDDSTGWDMVTLKYGPTGNRLWERRYRTDYEDFGSYIALDNSGNVCVVGSSGNPYLLTWDFATVKYDNNGYEQWAVRFNGPAGEDDEPHGLAVDLAGNVYVAGGSLDSTSNLDFTTIKYTPAGETAWVRRYNGAANGPDEAFALGIDGAANVYVTGYSQGASSDIDYATVKYDTDGNELWAKRYDGPASGFDEARAIAVGAGGYATVTGSSAGSGTRADYATVRYRPDGTEDWVERYDGPDSDFDEAASVGLDPTGGVCVTGTSWATSTGNDFLTIRYAAVGIEEPPHASRPSPLAGATIVSGVLNLTSAIGNLASDISLLDASGRTVRRLAAGSNDVSGVAPGLYFVCSQRSAAGGERSALLKVLIAH